MVPRAERVAKITPSGARSTAFFLGGQALAEAGVPQITKDIPGRSVRSAGARVAYLAQGRVRWTAAAGPVLSAEAREAAANFAEAS